MRKIKFRVWNKIEEKMVYYDEDFSSPDMTLNGVLIAHQDQSNVSYIYDLMQYTGLKDKQGIEIYEGDIVKHIPEPNSYGGWWDGIVTWQPEGSMGWCVEPLPENKHRGRYGMNYRYVFEIIGNIHQNPELLCKEIKKG